MKDQFFRFFMPVLVCIALALAGPSVELASTQRQKEIRVTSQHIDGGLGDLTSLEALVGHSDAVIVGRVVSARPSSIAPGGLPAGDFFSTAYSLGVEQVLCQWRWPKHHGNS